VFYDKLKTSLDTHTKHNNIVVNCDHCTHVEYVVDTLTLEICHLIFHLLPATHFTSDAHSYITAFEMCNRPDQPAQYHNL
jgi:hypothetical protein